MNQERTEPVPTADPAGPPVIRGPFRQPGLGARIEEYERRGAEDFFAGEYRPRPARSTCAVGKAPAEHCLCAADPDALRYALAQISIIHTSLEGVCSGCGTPAVLCGYLALLRQARNGVVGWTPPPGGGPSPGAV